MQINLFDTNFAQSACSVAWATPELVEYVRGRYRWEGVTMFTDAWITNPVVDEVESTTKVAWLHEPRCLWPILYQDVPQYRGKFDLVLTYSQEYCAQYGMAFAPYGGVWIDRDAWGMRPKTKLVSMLYGTKRTTYGHQLRHLIGEMFNAHGIEYFGFKGQKTDYSQQTKLRVHGDYMFSIVIETCREDWLFTEILLDCLAVGTIPIFWGCPDIGRFFNRRGILSFETIPELETILGEISPQMYAAMLPYARDNLQRVAEYAVTEDWMYKHIFKEYFER